MCAKPIAKPASFHTSPTRNYNVTEHARGGGRPHAQLFIIEMSVVKQTLVGIVAVTVGICLMVYLPLTLHESRVLTYGGTPSVESASSRHLNSTHSLLFLSVLGPYRILSFPSDNHVIVRSVIRDPRPKAGFESVSVFMVEFRKHMGSHGGRKFVACGTSEAVSWQLKVRVLKNLGWVHTHFPKQTHDMAMIDCFGLPETPTGSRVFLWYRLDDKGDLYRVESEHPYFVPVPKKHSEHDNRTIVVCMALVRHVPPFLREFLRYYKYLGVDHVYMVADDSLIREGALQYDQFVEEAVREGFLSLTFWSMWLNTDEIHSYSYHLAHEDCVYRFQGVYDYALIIDSDDHFIPLVPHQNSLDYYIKKYCTVGACSFQWIEYYPDCGLDWTRLGPHGNVTNTSILYYRLIHYGVSLRVCLGMLMKDPKILHHFKGLLTLGAHAQRGLL